MTSAKTLPIHSTRNMTLSALSLYLMMVYWITIAVLVLSLAATNVSAEMDWAVRLADGPSTNCGRLEVFFAGEWGLVCSKDWDEEDTHMVCSQLGFIHREPQQWPSSEEMSFGSGNYGPLLGEVACASSASSLADCHHGGWGKHNCSLEEDIIHICCDPRPPSLPVRLTCPQCTELSACRTCPSKIHPALSDCHIQPAVAGIIEVMVDGVWGPISAEEWDMKEATVLCGQLGYPTVYPQGSPPPTIEDVWPQYRQLLEATFPGSGNGMESQSLLEDCNETHSEEMELLSEKLSRSLLQGVKCLGTESELLSCSMTGVGSRPNPSRRVAAVKCGFLPHFNCFPEAEKNVRLRAGAVDWKGRVEVKRNGAWGTVCDRGFDELDGNTVCRQLGYGTVKSISGYGRGVGNIHYTDLSCTGRETRIGNCLKSTETRNCGHAQDVGLECNVPDSSTCLENTLHHVVMKGQGGIDYPELRERSGRGLICYNGRVPTMTRDAADLICRQTLGQFILFLTRISSPPAGYDGVYYSGRIECSGNEKLLSECEVNVSPQSTCREGYIILRCTPAVADLVPDVARLKSSLQSFFALQNLPMYTLRCAYQEGCLGQYATQYGPSRKLLRFDSLAWNYGLADFKPVAYSRDWQYHDCHNHYHSMEEFAHYNVFYYGTSNKASEGHKASFCLEDSVCASGHNPRYTCNPRVQAISVNCGDLYGQHLDCQWVDITRLGYGEYLLQVSLNPLRLGMESDYGNNDAFCRIVFDEVYSWIYGWEETLEVGDCWLSDHE